MLGVDCTCEMLSENLIHSRCPTLGALGVILSSGRGPNDLSSGGYKSTGKASRCCDG